MRSSAKPTSILQFFLFLLIFVFISCSTQKKVPAGDWTPLFEENAAGWQTSGQGTWEFENGEIIATSGDEAGFIYTNHTYSDFELELEFNPDEKVNSGVFIRCNEGEFSATGCYEINIWDGHPDQNSRTGAIVTHTVPMSFPSTINRWNTYRISAKGNLIEAWINGIKTAELKDSGLTSGHIGMQVGNAGSIRFRNVRIQELE